MEMTGQQLDDDIEESKLSKGEPVAFMVCGYCNVKIQCPTISEAEQRARLHNYNTAHSSRWEYQ